jgi:hypothetical protein
MGAEASMATVLDRDPAACVGLENLNDVSQLLHAFHEVGARRATGKLAKRAAADAPLTDPRGLAALLNALRTTGAVAAVAALMERDPAAHVDPSTRSPAGLLATLHIMEERQAAESLALRAAALVPLADRDGLVALLRVLRSMNAAEAIAVLMARNPVAHVDLAEDESLSEAMRDEYPVEKDIANLRHEFQQVGAEAAASALVTRCADAGMFCWFRDTGWAEIRCCPSGREPDGSPSSPWGWEDLF